MQTYYLQQEHDTAAVDLIFLNDETVEDYQKQLTAQQQQWIKECNFSAKHNQVCLLSDEQGSLAKVVCGWDVLSSPWSFGKIIDQLPTEKVYRLITSMITQLDKSQLAFTWSCHCYQFTQYKVQTKGWPFLCIADFTEQEQQQLKLTLHATYRVRDLINTPAEDCGPDQLEQAMQVLAEKYSAKLEVIAGDDLIESGYPLIHAVGRASHREPRLLVLRWGQEDDPRVALVGKGVCFDSGGLQIKPHTSMQTMKKDMGGAAHMLALAEMLIATAAPVQLTLWIAAVDNSVSANAFRPGDIFYSRKGLTVEIGHTDAEGRLCLADMLTAATSEKVDLVIDYATLTGAQRVALGMGLPAVFANNTAIAQEIHTLSMQQHDPVWPLPLFEPYRALLDSKIADLSSIGSSPYGGAITAALFLERFLERSVNWIHIDAGAYNPNATSGKPEGGEAMGLITLYHYVLRYFR